MGHKQMWCWIFLLAVLACRQDKRTLVTVRLESATIGSGLTLALKDTVYRAVLDSAHSAVFRLDERMEAGYAHLGYERDGASVYIEARKNLEVRKSRKNKLHFSGENAEKSMYLNSEILQEFPAWDGKEEKEYIKEVWDQLQKWYAHLDSLHFEEAFQRIERKRLRYVCCNRLAFYAFDRIRDSNPGEYFPTEEFEAFVKAMLTEEEDLMVLTEYRTAFRNMIPILARQNKEKADRLQLLKNGVQHIKENIRGPRLSAYLIDRIMTEYIEQNGVDGLQSLLPVYFAMVTDPARVTPFKELYNRWAKVANGQLLPEFTYRDIHDKRVRLSDLKGKYVYIDIWATWCYFCCREIPGLRKLEKKMKGRNICFVSISIDKDKTAWEKKVREERLEGIQLNTAADRTFMEAYMIRGIPRFILIDPEGKIVNANMTRPSDPETFRILDTLPGM